MLSLIFAAVLALSPPPPFRAFAADGSPREDARVTAMLVADPLTQAAIARAHSPNIDALKARVADLTVKHDRGEASEAALAEAEEALITALSALDSDYAVKIAEWRAAMAGASLDRAEMPPPGASGGAADTSGGMTMPGASYNQSLPGSPAYEPAPPTPADEARRRQAEQQEMRRDAEAARRQMLAAQQQASARAQADRARSQAQAPVRGLPQFPWPPPTPSERLNLTRAQILPAALRANPSLADVGDRIVGALQAAGYSEFSFYAAPRGFAIVARLERIEPDGTPAPEQLRFLAPDAAEPFSLTSYVTRLFFAPEGYYRQIVFAVTTEVVRPSGAPPDAKSAAALLEGGADRLPPEFRAMPFTRDYQVAALIYEYHKGPDARDVKTLTPGRIDARTNLVRAGIYPKLVSARN